MPKPSRRTRKTASVATTPEPVQAGALVTIAGDNWPVSRAGIGSGVIIDIDGPGGSMHFLWMVDADGHLLYPIAAPNTLGAYSVEVTTVPGATRKGRDVSAATQMTVQ